jgi:hypothetical protein
MNTTQFEQFREQVYQGFARHADALLDLIDALCSQTGARSVAELSLEPVFRRGYSSLYKAIDGVFAAGQETVERGANEQAWLQRIAGHIAPPERQPYWLFGTDTTSVPRPFARTLEDRGYVYQPNMLRCNKPVTIGHRYSTLAHLPEKPPGDPAWVVPLHMRRVMTSEAEDTVGSAQLAQVMGDETLPWHDTLCVHVGDTRYSTPPYLAAAATHEHLVTVSRLRRNRTLYRQPPPATGPPQPGHPTWYGEPFKLNAPQTRGEPDAQARFTTTSRRGQPYTVEIMAWHDMLMRGKRNAPMHTHPCTLLRVVWRDAAGQPLNKYPLWLGVFGQRRYDLSLRQMQQSYAQRYDLEHFFRFGKQRLLLTAFQTPDVRREHNWWLLVQLAYVQLWLARHLVETLPRPWERYLPRREHATAAPSMTQRGFGRFIRQLGSPTCLPKPRGYSPGRPAGTRLPPRVRSPVVKKSG